MGHNTIFVILIRY